MLFHFIMNMRTFRQLGTFGLSFRTANLAIICSLCFWFPSFYVFTGMFEELALFCFSHLPLKTLGTSEFRVCCKGFPGLQYIHCNIQYLIFRSLRTRVSDTEYKSFYFCSGASESFFLLECDTASVVDHISEF